MKNRKKIPLLVLIMVVIMVFSACNGQIVSNSSSVSTTSPEETTQETTSTDATEVDTQENTEKQETSSASENTISENSISENSVSENEIAIAYKTFDEAKTMYVISPVNVRKGPSTDYDIVSHLATQQEVKVTGQADNNGWYQIMIDNEQAYVSNHYLSDTLIETPPAPQTAAANAPQKQKTPSGGGTIMVGDLYRCRQLFPAEDVHGYVKIQRGMTGLLKRQFQELMQPLEKERGLSLILE